MKLATLLTAAIVLTAPATACTGADVAPIADEDATAVASPASNEDVTIPNFLLLLSDEANDIGDFDELWVTISAIGFVQGDEECVVEYPLDELVSVNLVTLTGENAVALWEGLVPDGTYTRVFLYVDEAWGILADSAEDEPVAVRLPSGKLQVNVPVTVDGTDTAEQVAYVFDVTVHRAGNSGAYILSPQLSESGAGVKYRLLVHTEERIRTGKPDWSGQPDGAGARGSNNGAEAQATPPHNTGKPDDAGLSSEKSRPESAGKPEDGGAGRGKG
jgi:hypothetical protein